MERPSQPHARLRLVCLSVAVFSLMAHGYRYLSMSFSGDAMLLSQVGEEAYQLSLGRFMQPVYWQIRGYITAPLLIGLFATGFLCAAAALMVRLLGITRPLDVALSCGVLATCETLAVSNATYLPWTDVYMLALLLSVLGVTCFFRMKHGWLLSPVLYCLSLGLYQSYLPAAATLILLVLIVQLLHGGRLRDIWARGTLACASLLLGLLLYALVLNVLLRSTGTPASHDYNGVGRVGLVSLDALPGLLADTYLTPLRLLFTDQPVIPWHISTVPAALNIACFAPAALLLLWRARSLDTPARLTLAFLLGMLPLGMNFIQFISKGIASGLTIYAYTLAYLLPIALTGGEGPRLARAARSVCVAALGVLLCHNVIVSNQMALKRDLELSATTSAMARLLDRVEQTDGYVPGETPVVLIGMLPSSQLAMERPGFEQLARAQGMRYTYGAAYETSTYWYLQMALGEPIRLVSHSERERLSQGDAAQALTAFPDEGCCRMIDGYLYLRIC
ncbi:MAG: glucosyltransferase domain-containing protein [Candidatus Ventricola sp.]